MNKRKSSFKPDDPYRFELTREYLKDRYSKIKAKKSEIETEMGIRRENESNK